MLQEVIANRHIGIPDSMFFEESHHFHYVNGRPQAARKGQGGVGAHDDCIIALIGALLANDVLPRAKTEREVQQSLHASKERKATLKQRKDSRRYTSPYNYV